MKSGNVIVADRVTDWQIKSTGNEVTYLRMVQDNPKNRVIVASLDLNQIEGIVEER